MTTQTMPTEKRPHDGTPRLPMGVGQLSRGWLLFFALTTVGSVIGLIGYLTERSQGMVATGMRDLGTMGGATWGIYISLVVYFVGISFFSGNNTCSNNAFVRCLMGKHGLSDEIADG